MEQLGAIRRIIYILRWNEKMTSIIFYSIFIILSALTHQDFYMNIILKNTHILCIVFLSFSFILKPMKMWPELPEKKFLVDQSKYPHLKGRAIYRKDIFEWLTEKTEKKLIGYYNTKGKLPKLPSATQALINNLQHETSTLSELKSSVQDKLTHNNGKFSILYLDVMKHPEKRHLIDIGALQAKHPGAVFQTASRPSGLEGRQMIYQANKEKTKSEHAFDYEHNGFIDILGPSAVQGEEAAISCAIKAIYQIYMIDKNINFFANLSIETNPRGRIEKINSEFLNQSDIDNLSDNICVRLWQNIPVTTGTSNVLFQSRTIADAAKKSEPFFNSDARPQNRNDANMLVTEPCFISQVNVSAVDRSEDKKKCIKGFGKDYTLADKTAYAALKAAYEATVYAAVKEKKTKVFFTLVGCGAFKNKLEWVADVLDKLSGTITKSGLDITLIAMDANGHLVETQKESWNKIKDLATKTKGKITDASKLDESVKFNDPQTPLTARTPTKTDVQTIQDNIENPSFFSTHKKLLLGIGGGLSLIGLLFVLKYYYQTNATVKR